MNESVGDVHSLDYYRVESNRSTNYLVLACLDKQRRCDRCSDEARFTVTAPNVRTLYRCFEHWLPVRWVLEANRYNVRYGEGAVEGLGIRSY